MSRSFIRGNKGSASALIMLTFVLFSYVSCLVAMNITGNIREKSYSELQNWHQRINNWHIDANSAYYPYYNKAIKTIKNYENNGYSVGMTIPYDPPSNENYVLMVSSYDKNEAKYVALNEQEIAATLIGAADSMYYGSSDAKEKNWAAILGYAGNLLSYHSATATNVWIALNRDEFVASYSMEKQDHIMVTILLEKLWSDK
jgi:hypothetical protein